MNKRLLLILVLVALIGGGGGLAYYAGVFSDDPAEVNLTDSTDAPGSGGTITDFDGTWTVDSASGSLDADPPTSTFAGYRISEEFGGIGTNIAVGRTQNVEGTMTIAGDEITDVDLEIDMTTLASDKEMRDNALRDRGLQTGQFPTATFTLTEPVSVSEPEEGKVIDAQATGDLTLHGVTKQVTIPLKAKWSGDTITVTASFDVLLADYDIEKPTTARVVSIADSGTVEMQLLFKQS